MGEENLAENAFKALSRLANAGRDDDGKEFVRLVTSDHRTLQQCMFKMFAKCMEEWSEAKKTGMFDLRNEDTVNQCAKAFEKVENFGCVRCI